MTSLPNTPTTATPLLVIPAAVAPFGPQFSRLPDELIAQIFKLVATSMFPASSRFNEIIEPKMFAILNRHYAFRRIRSVSATWATFFMQAFYENFTFRFQHVQPYNLWSPYLTSIPAPLPRPNLRHHLRSLRIEIVLENYYFTAQDTSLPLTTPRSLRKITTPSQLLVFCPAARQLHSLTNPWTGFSSLARLELCVRTDFRHFPLDDEFLRVLDELEFVVRAGRVLLSVTDEHGKVKPEHEEVRRRIVVK